ncbi:hypothetical protein [Desulfovibrio gilichinskyi]|uniref:Uncharacterized protein n=1 Tax=Desulfovibrio gilichinskyi TaxID=1519643 RepID=A0A1X7C3B0_9BACT|nr:hypothetical protein [Desulfovibrio gilichinskyi]SME89277.1 hypothetical protein SAMN06295933_0263 [Desulfovibrio gilichinskyi]
MKTVAVIGIDPGKSGAMALIAADGTVDIQDWEDGPIVASKLLGWTQDYQIKGVGLERVHSMPKQGVASTFKFGENFGIYQGLLLAHMLAFETVTPQSWMKSYSIVKKGPNDKPSLTVARQMFPSAPLKLKKHDGRADALLLAEHIRRTTNAFRS